MRQAVRTTLGLRRLPPTLLLTAVALASIRNASAPAYTLYAGQSPEPATQEPPRLFDQAERLIAKLTPDERRRLIAALVDVSPNKADVSPIKEMSRPSRRWSRPRPGSQGRAPRLRRVL